MNKKVIIFLISVIPFFCSCALKEKNINKKWWKESVFYQIYMPSYADSNGDGFGNFRGMTQCKESIKEQLNDINQTGIYAAM